MAPAALVECAQEQSSVLEERGESSGAGARVALGKHAGHVVHAGLAAASAGRAEPSPTFVTHADSRDAAPPTSLSDTHLAHYAITALIEEARLTPKPALVDQRGSGAHRDLDLATMLRSAHALEPTFGALARAARRRGEPSALLRTELAQIGRAGEQDMLRATGGSNAHRGAIWIVGLLVAGAAMDAYTDSCASTFSLPLSTPSSTPSSIPSAFGSAVSCGACSTLTNTAHSTASQICTRAARIACFPDRFAAPADSHGERARQRYQVGGARREAQDGFPHVIDVGLPALLAARAEGIDENAARVDALLAIMASLDDTCLLHRAGLAGLRAGQHGARRVLQAGGSSTPAGRIALAALEHELLSLNASPGGAADLLAATLFLDMLAHHDAGRSPDPWNI